LKWYPLNQPALYFLKCNAIASTSAFSMSLGQRGCLKGQG
jgi:hypothetical protein